jgi:hypothetical protein
MKAVYVLPTILAAAMFCGHVADADSAAKYSSSDVFTIRSMMEARKNDLRTPTGATEVVVSLITDLMRAAQQQPEGEEFSVEYYRPEIIDYFRYYNLDSRTMDADVATLYESVASFVCQPCNDFFTRPCVRCRIKPQQPACPNPTSTPSSA